MWQSIGACVYLYLVNLAFPTEGITYLKGISTPKWTTRKIPLSKWLEDNNWRLAPYGNKEFTKIFRQYKHVIQAKYYEEAPANWTDTSLGKYVQSLFFTSPVPITKKLLKKDKIKLGKLKLIKENVIKLEEKLGLTTVPPSTTPEPSTEPYTGPSTRRTVYSSFDPDYIFDPNWPLKEFKRLRRDISIPRYSDKLENEVSSLTENNQKLKKLSSGALFNAFNIFPSGDLTQTQPLFKDNKLWIRSKREEFNVNKLNIEKHTILKTKETKLKRFRREINELKSGKSRCFRRKKDLRNKGHFIVKRDLGKIVRRSTKRPHLSRKFKSQSMKRYMQDSRLASMLTRIQSNITIVPEFLMMKQVWDDCARNNLSTLFYVYNNVAYFGSVPPNLLTTKASESSTKEKAMTFELGATQVLGANIFEDEKNGRKNEQKVSPADVDIPSIDLEERSPKSNSIHVESKINNAEDFTGTEAIQTTKLKRTRKKKSEDKTESSDDTTKKTRAKRKTTKAMNGSHSLESSLEEQDTISSKVKSKKRKIRSLDIASRDIVMEVLPTFLCFIHNDMHLRRKRNVDDQDDTKKIEDLGEASKLGHFGKLKENIKRSKNKLFSYVKEKKESLVDMPRRARYIAREMYLDGKFFFRELKEVPDRMKKDFHDKKEFLGLIWDMLKIFMPVTEVGEKGGTTPEPKIVEDPKQYVKNPEDYLTPDISSLDVTVKTSLKHETFKKSSEITEEITKIVRTFPTKTTSRRTEKNTAPAYSKAHIKERATIVETSTVTWSTTTEEPKTRSIHIDHNDPVLITDELSTEKTYHTRVVGPDYVPTNTRLDHLSAETTTRRFDKLDQIIDKVNDEKTFDRVASTMKDKEFMNDIIKNADTERLRSLMGSVKPQDMLRKLDEKTIHKMGKLMTELDSETIKQMQELVLKTTNINQSNNNIVKTR